MSKEVSEKKVLLAGIDLSEIPFDFIKVFNVEVDYVKEKIDNMESLSLNKYSAILCGNGLVDAGLGEIVQTAAHYFPTSAVFVITKVELGENDTKILMKHEFTNVFKLPRDVKLLEKKLTEAILFAFLRPIKIVDLQADEVVPFDIYIYLPANFKIIKYISANQTIDAQRVEKLMKSDMQSVYISSDSYEKFTKYYGDILAREGKESETIIQQKKERVIKGLISEIFEKQTKGSPFTQGSKIFANLQNIAEKFLQSKRVGSTYKILKSIQGGKADSFAHSNRVASYACLFSTMLNLGDPEALYIAGLMHDIGELELKITWKDKPIETWTSEEHEIFKLHPQAGVRVIKNKKINLSPKSEAAILLHHQYWDRKGFPTLRIGMEIPIEAQILTIADKFDEFTLINDGKSWVSPQEALEKIEAEGYGNIVYVEKIKKILNANDESTESVASA